MVMTNPEQLYGTEVRTSDGAKLGKVQEVYLDDASGTPEWAEVKTGMFGSKTALVPLASAEQREGALLVPFDRQRIKSAPHHEAGTPLSEDDEAQLFEYFGIPYGGPTVTAATATATTAAPPATEPVATGWTSGVEAEPPRAAGHDVSGPTTDDAMTRSEEEVRVGTRAVERGRARLRKYVVTENVERTVPVSREEVRLEREPITAGNVGAATSGPAISDEEHEVTLYEEEPVVETRAVPKERVRLAKTPVEDEQEVAATVRKEQIELEDETARER